MDSNTEVPGITDAPTRPWGHRRRGLWAAIAAAVVCVLAVGATLTIKSRGRGDRDVIELFRATIEAEGFSCERGILFGDNMFRGVTGGMVCERSDDRLRILTFESEKAMEQVVQRFSFPCRGAVAPNDAPALGVPETGTCCPKLAVFSGTYLVDAGFISAPQNSPLPGLSKVAAALGTPIRDLCEKD